MQTDPSPRRPLAARRTRSGQAQAELSVLRAAATVLDLEQLLAPTVAERPAVQALIRAAWDVFRECERDDASGEPPLN
ncbi:hypothetical protein [Methylobacterium sp. JK268]